MGKVSATNVCQAMGVQDPHLKDCQSQIQDKFKKVREAGTCDIYQDPTQCYSREVAKSIRGELNMLREDVIRRYMEWGFSLPPPNRNKPTHPSMGAALGDILTGKTPKVVSFGIYPHTSFMSRERGPLAHFSEKVLPWLKSQGYKSLVVEWLPHDLPPAELKAFAKRGKINPKTMPKLHRAVEASGLSKEFPGFLKQAQKLGIQLVGGGLEKVQEPQNPNSVQAPEPVPNPLPSLGMEIGPKSTKDEENTVDAPTFSLNLLVGLENLNFSGKPPPPSEHTLKVRDQLRETLAHQLAKQGKVAVLTDKYFNDLDEDNRSLFSNKGLKAMNLTKDQVVPVDMVVPEVKEPDLRTFNLPSMGFGICSSRQPREDFTHQAPPKGVIHRSLDQGHQITLARNSLDRYMDYNTSLSSPLYNYSRSRFCGPLCGS